MFHSVTESVFLKRLLQQLGFDQAPIPVYQDNQSAIQWALGRENFHRVNVKHLISAQREVPLSYIREVVKEGCIAIEH